MNVCCETVAILGVPFHNVTMDETLALIEEQIREGGFHQVATANVDFLKNAMRDKKLQSILCSCDMVVPDGMPVVWMSRLMGAPLKERVSGIDLVERLAELSAKRGYGIFLLGASENRSRLAARMLRQRHPNLRIVGRYSPEQRPLDDMDHEEILHRIEEARPDILLVAFGNPKQEQWLAMHRDRLKVPVCIGVGGTLDFLSGTVSRAPSWVQRMGFEWFYRMLQEPQRLAARYAIDALCLIRHIPAYLAAILTQPKHPAQSSVEVRQIGNTKLISMIGNLTGAALDEFNAYSRDACAEGMNIVLDMSKTCYMGPESLGSLIQLESRMRQRENLWLAELPSHLSRILRTGRLHNYFMTTTMVSDALYRTAKAEQRLLTSFAPDWEQIQQNNVYVDVRVELLQGICRQIIAVNETEDSALVPDVFASAGT
ncbi:WecB/TagA/CpsF family glycosyltransferase [Acidicapsa ligni]|uniref:WecB/TagA/CpsF family glycosyltransferase n=1 Tax=Acidicapsa ligni TaxID=542300 RepID=UPI0021E0C3EB|nr:WecB/TagA/CpsF family glycosyltransferase [Acidicapsa ligni]